MILFWGPNGDTEFYVSLMLMSSIVKKRLPPNNNHKLRQFDIKFKSN